MRAPESLHMGLGGAGAASADCRLYLGVVFMSEGRDHQRPPPEPVPVDSRIFVHAPRVSDTAMLLVRCRRRSLRGRLRGRRPQWGRR